MSADLMPPDSASQVPGDSRVLRSAYARFPSGVVAVCALVEGRPHGFAASSFTSVSLAPPLLSICVGDTSETWPVLRPCPVLGISVIAADEHAVCRQLGTKGVDRFAGVSWQAAADGAVFLDRATAWFACTIHDELAAGDHIVVLLEVAALRTFDDLEPLVFHDSRFRAIA